MFTKHSLPLKTTALFSGLFNDYIHAEKSVESFYDVHINKQAYKAYLEKNNFESVNRTVLTKALERQAKLVENTHPATWSNITSLEQASTFTVTTGHQLCLFTGPLYFIYKIVSTINLAKTLTTEFPDKHFVPVYWMASEDHDFEEINHIHTYGKKVTWSSTQKGSVGEFSTEGLAEVIAELKTILGTSDHANTLIHLFENAYLKHSNLADATRYLVNELFGTYGLVILDGNDKDLKGLFKDAFRKDIFDNSAFKAVNQSIEQLKTNYTIQVNPREINTFYKDTQLRERIEKEGDHFKVLNTNITFSKQELENLIETAPEKLSPNVVLRPLFQQQLLPNVAYVGGPGEIAYWLEYKTLFETYGITFPVLMPRNFVVLMDKGTQNKLQKLNLSVEDTFKDGEELVKQFIKTHNDVSLEDAKAKLNAIYASILETVSAIDKTLAGTTEAEKQKTINGLMNIEQKINRSLKQKSETDVNQIWGIKGKLFPNNVPQERYDNFSMYFTRYGNDFVKELMPQLTYDLSQFQYTVLSEN